MGWASIKRKRTKKVRIIAGGGGRKPKLSVGQKIILTLVYLRHMTTFQLLGIQFGVSESTANDVFNYWLPILRELLPSSLTGNKTVTVRLVDRF
ncbi:transposase family protein [Nostoc sphaeroides CHAB 2801]|uniref:helix-turn-helix domain-containing protein n=1 Tax=Nostoc sphaeroides TaxID=446679 RepID=UPI001E527074|nr:transposase family protein [Nostoc sphaeroides]MCC5633149.1 transposase family protein [Nostoc sphaeroides CHAB 2801]